MAPRAYRLTALLIAGLMTACGTLATVADVVAEEKPLAVMLAHTVQLDGCTGVRLGGGLVATAKHCTDPLTVGESYSDLIIGYLSPTHDFAVLAGDATTDAVHMDDAVFGEQIFVIGYPAQLSDGKGQLTITDGIFTGAVDEDMERITNFCYYGNSGGGAWNDRGGLVGLVVEIRPTDALYGEQFPAPMPAHCYMVPAALVRSIVL